jgi:Fur family peroxide stress response transcriptional regulator
MKISYTELLNSNGLKCTPQRIFILESIDKKGHIDIDNLYLMIKNKCENISLSTIYKNINIMVENGVLFEVKIPNLKSVYETKKDKHSHFYCKYCGNITDMKISKNFEFIGINELENKEIQEIEICFSGKCEKC